MGSWEESYVDDDGFSASTDAPNVSVTKRLLNWIVEDLNFKIRQQSRSCDDSTHNKFQFINHRCLIIKISSNNNINLDYARLCKRDISVRQ